MNGHHVEAIAVLECDDLIDCVRERADDPVQEDLVREIHTCVDRRGRGARLRGDIGWSALVSGMEHDGRTRVVEPHLALPVAGAQAK